MKTNIKYRQNEQMRFVKVETSNSHTYNCFVRIFIHAISFNILAKRACNHMGSEIIDTSVSACVLIHCGIQLVCDHFVKY